VDIDLAHASIDELLKHAKRHPDQWEVHCERNRDPYTHGDPFHVPSQLGGWLIEDHNEHKRLLRGLIDAGAKVVTIKRGRWWWPF